MKITEAANRKQNVINHLVNVWEASVRATHLFLSDDEINRIKAYVPQALAGVTHLIIALLWGLRTALLKCSLSLRKNGEKEWGSA